MGRKKHFDKARWMVNRERFHISEPAPTFDEADVPIQDVLKDIFKSLDSNDRSWLRTLEEEWSIMIGAASGHTRLGRFNRNTLVIYVDSSVWLHELMRYAYKDILARLQKRFGAERIKQIRIQADPGVSPVNFIKRK